MSGVRSKRCAKGHHVTSSEQGDGVNVEGSHAVVTKSSLYGVSYVSSRNVTQCTLFSFFSRSPYTYREGEREIYIYIYIYTWVPQVDELRRCHHAVCSGSPLQPIPTASLVRREGWCPWSVGLESGGVLCVARACPLHLRAVCVARAL